MDLRDKITSMLEREIADVFMLDKTHIEAHHELKFREDLVATSLQYFPILTALEEELDIDIDFHEFQIEAKTIAQAIDYITALYIAQQK